MREPAFWQRRGTSGNSWIARTLLPLAGIYGAVTAWRMARDGVDVGIPVICVGNYHVGGAGKTPAVLALVALLRDLGETPVVLSRGYGGRLRGPIAVDPVRHTANDVGDEPLMMSAMVPVVVGRDRIDGAALARSRGATVIVMDDGFQNAAVVKDASIVVIDGDRGLGNGLVFPAGPLRAPLRIQLPRTDALVVIGDGRVADGVAAEIAAQGKPVWRARIVPDAVSVAALQGRRVLAFAGIGDPDRFFRTLRNAGIDVAAEAVFDDHHIYTPDEVAALRDRAAVAELTLVTTQKDAARLGESAIGLETLAVTLAFDDPPAVRSFVANRIEQARVKRFRAH